MCDWLGKREDLFSRVKKLGLMKTQLKKWRWLYPSVPNPKSALLWFPSLLVDAPLVWEISADWKRPKMCLRQAASSRHKSVLPLSLTQHIFAGVTHLANFSNVYFFSLSHSFCRCQEVATRKEYVQLVDSVRDSGGEVKIFSSMHVSGERESMAFRNCVYLVVL